MFKLKSVTFRCTKAQQQRMETALSGSAMSRTDFISAALEAFLTFAEQEENRKLNLFELVEKVDATGSRIRFAEED